MIKYMNELGKGEEVEHEDYYWEFVDGRLRPGSTEERFRHCAMGLCTEAAELLEAMEFGHWAGVKEETGDSQFYMQGTRLTLGFTRASLVIPVLNASLLAVEGMIIESANLLNIAKKNEFYGVPINTEEAMKVCARWECYMDRFMAAHQFSRKEILQSNMDKLRKRYPEGFSEKAAQERADKC